MLPSLIYLVPISNCVVFMIVYTYFSENISAIRCMQYIITYTSAIVLLHLLPYCSTGLSNEWSRKTSGSVEWYLY